MFIAVKLGFKAMFFSSFFIIKIHNLAVKQFLETKDVSNGALYVV